MPSCSEGAYTGVDEAGVGGVDAVAVDGASPCAGSADTCASGPRARAGVPAAHMAGVPVCIRPATPGDAPALLSIYAPYVRETAITFEYEVPSVDEFRARIERTLERYPYLVAERDGRAVGYAYAGPLGVRAAYDWSVEGSIYVARDARRTGAGRALYEALEAELVQRGFINLFACITEPALAGDPYSNRNSIEFHEHMGYKLVGEFERCGQKFGHWYNVVWMQRVLAEPVPGALHPRF